MIFTDLETERLHLKSLAPSHREFIYEHFSDHGVNRYLYDAEPLADLQAADEIIAFYTRPEPRSQHRWILIRKSDGAMLGTCGFHYWNQGARVTDVGYDLKEAYQGSGYMREAMEEIIRFARQRMKVTQIRACIYTDNKKSIRLAEKLGFVPSDSDYYEVFRGEKYLHHVYVLRVDSDQE